MIYSDDDEFVFSTRQKLPILCNVLLATYDLVTIERGREMGIQLGGRLGQSGSPGCRLCVLLSLFWGRFILRCLSEYRTAFAFLLSRDLVGADVVLQDDAFFNM